MLPKAKLRPQPASSTRWLFERRQTQRFAELRMLIATEQVAHFGVQSHATFNPTQAVTDHDAWFDAQVGLALKGADDPAMQWIPHDVVKGELAKHRAV